MKTQYRTTTFLPVALLGMLFIAGCSLVGAVGYKAFGPTKVPAEYEPKKEAMLVLADAYGSPAELQPYADQIAVMVVDKLRQNQGAPLIDQSTLIRFRSTKGINYEKMNIPQIGSAMKAQQVLYIHLKNLSATDIASDVVKAQVSADVRVVSVANGQTLWPDIGSTHEITAPAQFVRKEGSQTAPAARGEMMDQLAEQVAKLFYSHTPDFEDKHAIED